MRGAEKVGAMRLCGAFGVISLLSYAVAVLFSPSAYPGYDWMSQAVSDLSAISSPSRELWLRLSCLYEPCGITCVMAASLYVAERNLGDRLFRTGIYLFAAMNWVSTVGYRLFPLANGGKELSGLSEFMHVYVVTTAVVLLSIASLACIVASGFKPGGSRGLSAHAAVALLMMFAGAVGSGLVPAQYFGIAERLSLIAAVAFNAVLGLYLLKGRFPEECPNP